MTNSTPTEGSVSVQTAENAILGKSKGIWQSILSVFAPADNSQELDSELPDTDLFSVKLSFSRHDVIFTVSKESFLLLRSYLDDPGRKSFFFQSHWINKEILCNAFVEAYVQDSQMLPTRANDIRGKQHDPLDKKTRPPQGAASSSLYDITASSFDNKITCPRMHVPRGTSFHGRS